MLMDRVLGAITFRTSVYGEVEKDSTFTGTAWILVAVVAVLNQLATYFYLGNVGAQPGIFSLVLGIALALAGFALMCWVVAWVGKALFQAESSFEEMVRVLGLAYIWGLLSAILIFVLPGLGWIASLVALVAYLVAVKEALDLDWVKTAVTVVIGFIVNTLILAVVGGAIGVGAAVTGAF